MSGNGDDATAGWGAHRQMNPLEALMWRAEADPRLRSTICAIELLDTTPDWERFVNAHDWATRLVPRFRERVVEPLLGLGTPCWSVDPQFDLHYHVRRIRLPEGGGWTDVLEIAEQIAMTPFDRVRSPWEAVLIEGLPDGKAAYLLKLHHSTTDGMGAVGLFAQLHSRKREPTTDKLQKPPPLIDGTTPANALFSQVANDARGVPAAIGAAGGLLRRAARPDRAMRDAARFGGSLRRVLADPDADGSPLLRGRSLSWRFQAMDVHFADLRGAGKAAGGSLNDAFVASLLGGFRIYHEEMGHPIERMPMAIPISMRSAADSASGGNSFAAARLAAPVGEPDPAARMHAIGAQVRAAREEPAVDGIGMVAPALSRLPGPMISQIAGNMTKANDLQASNVPGIREDVYIAGARIERTYPFAPLPGCAAMITLVSHGDMCCIGVNLDPAAITEPDRFGRCLEAGFHEVLALNPSGGTVVRRT